MRAASSHSGLSHQERALGYVLVLSSQPASKPMEGSPMDVRIFWETTVERDQVYWE